MNQLSDKQVLMAWDWLSMGTEDGNYRTPALQEELEALWKVFRDEAISRGLVVGDKSEWGWEWTPKGKSLNESLVADWQEH